MRLNYNPYNPLKKILCLTVEQTLYEHTILNAAPGMYVGLQISLWYYFQHPCMYLISILFHFFSLFLLNYQIKLICAA